jgi:beta-aspartyl-peptidase (threonine type)
MPDNEEAIAAPRTTKLWDVAPINGFSLALHGGAGGQIEELSSESRAAFEEGLSIAHGAGRSVLERGGSALDAVCAAVEQLENHPLFNAGRGAALTSDGEIELDASVMDGEGKAGAIAASRHAKNPVYVARSVMERTPHLFLVAPSTELVEGWGHETAEQDYFITEARVRQLARIQARDTAAPRHGTVGAVAYDKHGNVAAATSTGGMVNQQMGRVGDTPMIGAGNYARNGIAAVSCTGDGEAFIRGVVAYDIAARIRYLDSGLADAVKATIENELTQKNASGGLVSVGGDGRIVVAHNSPRMFAAYEDATGLVMMT